ncbi:MAG: universal stress protein, partial [Bacteroidota bacterium]
MEHQLKRWLVGLDFSETDQRLLDYVAFLAGLLKPETVYFIHSPENLDMPEEVKAAVYQTDQPLDEYFKARMHQEVGDRFEGLTDEIKLEYKVTEGSPLQEILRWSKIKDVDLILVGKKHESGGSGVLPKRLARQAACSIGFVP